MKNNIIDRYIYDVTRRLPEKEREDVKKELTANIYDMLGDNPTNDEIEQVLYTLGSPTHLAEQYRTNPRYLISPYLFDDYIKSLKLICITVGSVLAVVGVIIAITSFIQMDNKDVVSLFGLVFSKAISMGIAGVFQAAVWTTIGFAIAEHYNAYKKKDSNSKDWRIEELPVIQSDKYKISLADSIVELVFGVGFGIVFVTMLNGNLPFIFSFNGIISEIPNILTDSFTQIFIYVIIIGIVFNAIESIARIIDRRWTPLVCATTILNNIVSVITTIVLILQPEIFNQEFITYLLNLDLGELNLTEIFNNGNSKLILMIIATIIIVVALINCIVAVYKTIKSQEEAKR